MFLLAAARTMTFSVVGRRTFRETDALFKLPLFANIEALHGTVVTHHPRPHFAGLTLGIFEFDRIFSFSHEHSLTCDICLKQEKEL